MDWCVAADEPATFEALQPEEEYSVGFYSDFSFNTIPSFSFASLSSAIKKKVLMTDMKHQMDQTTDVVNYGSTLEFGVAPCGFPFQFGKEDRGTEVLLCESESLAIPIRYRSAASFSSSTSIHPPVFRDDILPPPPELGATLPPPPPVFAVAKPAPHVLERGWSSLTTSMHSRTQQTPIRSFGIRDVLHAQLLKHSGTVSMKPDAEQLRLKWNKIHQLQQAEGYWDLTVELGELINLNVDVFNVFLKNKGVHSLGVKAHADILRLVATLLVLQLMRVEKVEEGELLQSLFQLKEPTESRSEHKEQIKKAVDWVRWADREYPCTCSRLEFGWNWESSTLQLLGFEPFPLFSPLVSLNLRNTAI